jgi:3-hydroxyisobutyrate dehydrogenase-like beta-hydroxyacid dehydrogenase
MENVMADTVTVIAAGEMGAGIGKRLSERGARVLTSLKGRGKGSAARAADAQMQDASDDDIVAQSDFILSVVPPGQAIALAERFKEPLTHSSRTPIYIDCNAVAPKTAEKISALLTPTKARVIDGGIIGGPPGANYSPSIYVSGLLADEALRLSAYGLDVRVIKGGIGAASALKMTYAGITKGTTAIGIALLLGAARAGCAAELKQEMSESQPQLLQRFSRQVPASFPKAYRWVAEMEEISAFLGEDPAARDMFMGIARLYERLAAGQDGSSADAKAELAALLDFCGDAAPQQRSKAG